MALAALIVAIASLAVSAVLGVQQHRLQQRLATIEEARRRDEQRPDIEVGYDRKRAGVALTFRNRGPVDLDSFHFEIIEKPTVVVECQVAGVGSGLAGELGALPLGAAHEVLVVENRDARGGVLHLRLTCASGDLRWQVHRSLEVRGYPKVW